MSTNDEELLIWSASAIDTTDDRDAPQPQHDWGGARTWAGLIALLLLVVVGVWFIGRGGQAEPIVVNQMSGDPAPTVNELRWSGPFPVEGVSSIEQLIVRPNHLYGIVDGWVATSSDMFTWTPMSRPPQLDPADPGEVLDYDVRRDVVIVLVRPPVPEFEPSRECPELSSDPVLRLLVSFDAAETWNELELPGTRPVGELFQTVGEGAVATDGVTAMATVAISRLAIANCVADQFGVDAVGAIPSRATDQIVYSDIEGNFAAIDASLLSPEDQQVLDEPNRIARHFVISPELTTAPAVGRPGPLLVANADEYITGFGGIPAQLSTNHGQSFVELDRDRGLTVRDDIVLQPAAGGTRISADLGVTWTTGHLDYAATLDTVQWNDVLYVLATAIDPDGVVEPGQPTLHSTRPGEPEIQLLEEFSPVDMSAITLYNDRLVVFGTVVETDGSRSQIVYFGDRPLDPSFP